MYPKPIEAWSVAFFCASGGYSLFISLCSCWRLRLVLFWFYITNSYCALSLTFNRTSLKRQHYSRAAVCLFLNIAYLCVDNEGCIFFALHISFLYQRQSCACLNNIPSAEKNHDLLFWQSSLAFS